ncbi:immunoglobulin superfamily member 2-like [Fundulus diaphanus]
MRVSGFLLWSPTLLILLALFLRCEADVNTEIQPGPLYRVLGSRLSISCSTSGFPNEDSDKDFQFYMASPARPTHFLNIISTADPDFGYARFLQRIAADDISLTRVDPNSVIFEIKNLRKEDEGEYECSAVKPRSILNGVFSVKAVVKVIDNSLSVTSGESATSLSYNEGEALTLTCQASTNTIQHVHLSFIWYLRKDGTKEAKPIISLDKDFTLTPGQGFEQRYREEAIRLDKLGEAEYRLQMTKLELSDQGQIYCQAQEWIQDPDRSWYMIAEKDAEEITLTVKPKGEVGAVSGQACMAATWITIFAVAVLILL